MADLLQYFGEYRILEALGSGGESTVYRALQQNLGREVALKILRAARHAPEESRIAFKLAAAASSSLDHPNIVRIFEIGEHEGQPYCSMEVVEGGHIGDHPPSGTREIAVTMSTITGALHHAHSRGVIHGDIKPSNILRTAEGVPVLSDFAIPDHDGGGSPPYMAPEQFGGGGASTRADIYGLGAVLYELLTGRPPYTGDSPLEVTQQVLGGRLERPGKIASGVDRDLEVLCLACLNRDPDGRPSSADALAREFDRVARGEPILTRRVGVITRSLKWCRRRPVEAGLVLITLIAILLSLAVPALRFYPPPPEADLFGSSIAVSDDIIAVGAPGSGRVELFDFEGKPAAGEQVELSDGYLLGFGLAIDEGILYSSGFTGSDRGQGLIDATALPKHNPTSWRRLATSWHDQHGLDLAPIGDLLWTGAPAYHDGTGHVLGYKLSAPRTTPIELSSPLSEEGHFFGQSIATNGKMLAIGAPGRGKLPGRVYVYSIEGDQSFVPLRTIEPPSDPAGARFGWDVDWKDNFLLVGAPGENQNSGAAYLFDLDNETSIRRFLPPAELRKNSRFGEAVLLGDEVAVIGAPQRDERPIALAPGHRVQGSGFVATFAISTGKLLHSLQSPADKSGDGFGERLALHDGGEILLISAIRAFAGSPQSEGEREWGRVEGFDLESGRHLFTLQSARADRINPLPLMFSGVIGCLAAGMLSWRLLSRVRRSSERA